MPVAPSQPPAGASPLAPPRPARAGDVLAWESLYGSSLGLAAARVAATHGAPVVLVLPDARAAQLLESEARFYAQGQNGGVEVLPFPSWECLPFDLFSPHPDIVSQRLYALHRLPTLRRGLLILTMANLMQRLAPREYVAAHSFELRAGARLDLEALRAQLARAAYHHAGQVMEPGEFSVRGGVVDVFPVGSSRPLRIDLFGDQVETIRYFDPESQRSSDDAGEVRLLPAREFPLNDEGIRKFRRRFRERMEGDPGASTMYREVSKGIAPAGIEFLFPLFHDRTDTLFDYLPAGSLFMLGDRALDAAAAFAGEVAERYEFARQDTDRRALAPADLFLDDDTVRELLAPWPRIEHRQMERAGEAPAAVQFATHAPPPLPVNLKSESPHGALLDYLASYPGRVLLVAETPGRREVIKAVLREHGHLPPDAHGFHDFIAGEARLAIAVWPLEKGLVLDDPAVSVVTEPQLYGERVLQRRRRTARGRDPESIIRSLAELAIGDPVVHETHGVGRYRGLTTLTLAETRTEFLTLEYRDGDKLYIPVMALHLISRYAGADTEHAPLHKLGGKEWEKARRRAEQKARDVAAELLEVQAVRQSRTGHAFPARDDAYAAFADDFPFEETPDQARAIDEVLDDMESGRPMDRLVCGDVGFGKTEVAMRAAWMAINGGQQVAVLVPTTLLAQQHYQNFADRFADLPVRVELLSRFRGKAEQAAVLASLRDGKVDLVIGTHRLLQADVRFVRLGLVIIDEEHRFGVTQKERLKRLRAQADVLTLTATPIPRTMNMALSGLRDISIIATPPRERLSVKTFVQEWNDGVIREACLREIRRGGQVYFLHNEVQNIERMAEELARIVPEAELRIAHGQMPERELERVMSDFYHQRFNVLLCSTIIESGIDVPTANTIIINRADRFGLAQLHQLRGRVGRSHHRAYAYLLVPSRRALKGDALKRLDALAALDELGAGFALASHDLEIRGAGEILGESQSGLIDEVGYAMYMELLRRAVESIRAGRLPAEASLEPTGRDAVEVNLHAAVLLPDDYVPDVHTRLILYKRVASAADRAQLDELHAELVDRFGPLPEPGRRLLELTAIRMRAADLGVRAIDLGPNGGHLLFTEQPAVDPEAIIRLLHERPGDFRMEGPNRLRILAREEEPAERLALLDGLLGKVGLKN